jgi:RHS repeat-associated protein
MTYPGGSGEAWSYDDFGNVHTYTTRAGQIETFTYDNRNRETGASWSDGTPGVAISYDATGQVLTMNDPGGSSSLRYSYDAAGQVLGETQTIPGLGAKGVGYTYDADGNRQTLTYPDGDVATYSYNGNNRLWKISINGAYPLVNYAYYPAGNPQSKSLTDTLTEYSYDAASRLTSVSHIYGSVYASFAYGYNPRGTRSYVRRETGLGDAYSYNATDQVTGVKYNASNPDTVPANPQSVDAFSYDPAGNWLNANSTTYDVNQLNQYTDYNGGGGTTYLGYDTNGNMTSNPVWTNGFDARNRLVSAISMSPPVAASVSYDSKNRPIKRTVGSTTYLVYDGWNLLAEYDQSGNQLAKYVYGARTDELIARVTPSGTVYYHEDGLGSIVRLTDGSGNVVEQYSYTAFGGTTIKDASGNTIPSSAYANRFMFTGREALPFEGLYDFRNRVYSPQFGRFLQTDPIRFAANDDNMYRYVRNNVAEYADPFGLWQLTIGAGYGYAAQISFGYNNGQSNFSLIGGYGLGVAGSFTKDDNTVGHVSGDSSISLGMGGAISFGEDQLLSFDGGLSPNLQISDSGQIWLGVDVDGGFSNLYLGGLSGAAWFGDKLDCAKGTLKVDKGAESHGYGWSGGALGIIGPRVGFTW